MRLHDNDDDRPRLPTCDKCRRRYVPWRVHDRDWARLPRELWPLALCPGCFVRVFIANGGDPEELSVSHEPWERMKAIWPIHLHRTVHIVIDGDIRLAKVVHILDVRKVRVRLLGHGQDAGEIVACWDGETRHKMTGRPVLKPIPRMG